MLFCFSACGTTETGSNPTNKPSESQTDTVKDNDENTFSEENSQVSSNIEETNENDTTQTQTNQSKPTSTTNQSTHTHSYSNATCTSPKKCYCGATSGTMLGHSYSDANCTTPNKCTRCDVTAGTALGHQFSSATCTSPQICSRCGTASGNALGHNYSAANCTSPKICTRCGQTVGSALGHNYVNNNCSRCGKVDPDSLPVGLDKLVVIDSSRNYKYDSSSFQDTYGNMYNGVHLFGYSYSGDSYAIYNLDGKFKTFTGTIVASTKLEDCAYVDYQIYVDNVLVYSQSQLERTTNKINFNITVTGAAKLTIKVKTYFKPSIVGSGYLGQGSIVNAQLSK